MVRYIATFIIVFSFCYLNAQEQEFGNYFEYTAYYDKYYEDLFKENPNDSAALKKRKHYDRVTRFWDTRIDENGLSYGYDENMTKVAMELIKNSSSTKGKNATLNVDWVNIDHPGWPDGPGSNKGKTRVYSLWVDPNDTNHILVGLYGGGIFETHNALTSNPLDVTWEPLTDHIPMRQVNSVDVINGTIYASSGFGFGTLNFSSASMNNHWGLGVVKSSDGGSTWQIPTFTTNGGLGFSCSDFKVLDNGIVYATSKNAFYKSTDGGNTWGDPVVVFPELNYGSSMEAGLYRMFVHPQNSDIIWFTSLMDNHPYIFHSDDGGDTWTNRYEDFENALNNYGISSINHPHMFSVTYFNNEVYFLLENKSGQIGNYYFKSSNGTDITFLNNFKNCSTSYCRKNGGLNYLTTTGNELFLIGMTNIYKVNDSSGLASSYHQGPVHVDVRDLKSGEHNGDTYYFIGTDGGINRRKNGASAWENITNNINGFLTIEMGYYSDNEKRLYDIGTQDAYWYRNDLDGLPQYNIYSYEGGSYTSPTIEDRTYIKTGTNNPLRGSTNITRTSQTYEILQTNIRSWSSTSPIIEDPIEPEILYRSNYDNFVVCGDYGRDPCTDITPQNLFSIPTLPNKRMNSIDVSKNSNKNILISYFNYHYDTYSQQGRNVLALSRDKGQTWEDVTPNFAMTQGDEKFRITDVDIDDHNPNRMWISIGNITNGIKVYQTENFGESWINISYNFPNIPVNRVEYDENRKRLYIGTDIGVYYLNTSTNQWVEMGTTLPKGIVTSMYIDDYHNKLVVSLFGRGVWEIDLDDCKDLLIDEDTIWSSSKVVCGDIIVKPGKTLTIKRANVTAQNIILMKNAKVVWGDGQLLSNNPTDQSYVVVGPYAHLSINRVTLNNYKVNVFENGIISMEGNTSMNKSEINIFNQGRIDYIVNSTVTFLKSAINLYEEYKYGLVSTLSNHITRLDQILMSGSGSVNVYNEEIYIQDEQLIQGEYNFIANDFIRGGSGVTTQVGSGIFETIGNVKVDLKARNYIMLEKGTYLHNKDFIAHIDQTLEDDLEVDYRQSDENGEIFNDIEDTKDGVNNSEKIKIYPNPSFGIFTYQLMDDSLIGSKISVLNNLGKVVSIQTASDAKGEIDLSNRINGVYYMIIENSSEKVYYKIIKK